MRWKLEPREVLHFAEENKEPQGDEGDEPKGGGEPQSDIDKLRSEYDSKLAELTNKLKEYEDRAEQSTKGAAATRARNAVLKTVQDVKKEIETVKAADPQKALDLALGHIDSLGMSFADTKQYSVTVEDSYRDTLAGSLAAGIMFENGGDVQTYKKQLLKAKTEDEMRLSAEKLKLETAGNKRTNGNGNGNGNRQLDGGRGAPSRGNVLKDMEDIDITTPEGRKKWEENRAKFHKEIAGAR